MEHRALALAYRPQRFDEVTGQHHVTAVLARALSRGRVHSAYLFSGPRGVGKTTTARILAKILNCPNVKDGVPDNTCDACRDITAGVSLDVLEIDGASNRGIADVQQLREKVRFAPAGGRYKVVIIDEVHQLSSDAFAALLKTLEEPPPNVVFVFATTDPLKLPDTIRSRCQRYDFGRLPLPAVVERLRQIVAGESTRGAKLSITDEAAFLLARKSEGSMRDAVSALDQVLSTGITKVDEAAVNEVLGLVSREVFFQLGETILARRPEAALAALHAAYRDGAEPRDLAEGLLDHLRSLLVLRVDPAAEDLLTAGAEERDRFHSQGASHDTPDLLRLIRIVTESLGAMRDSAQPLTHLETAVVEMATLEPGVRLGELLDRLRALESTGGRSGPGPSEGPGGDGGGRTPARRSVPPPAPEPPGRRKSPEKPIRKGTDVYGPGLETARGGGEDLVASAANVDVAGIAATVTLEVAECAPPGDADGDAMWDEVIRRVKERKIMTGVFLAESRRVGWQGDSLLIAADEVHRSLLEARENRELLLEISQKVFGRRVLLKFLENSDPAATAGNPAPRVVVAARPAVELPTAEDLVAAARRVAASEAAPVPEEIESVSGPMASATAPDAAEVPSVSPELKQAMVWFEGEIVPNSDRGGWPR